MKKFTNLLIICALFMSISSIYAQEMKTYSDDFSTPIDYLTTAIPAGSIWEAWEVNAGTYADQNTVLISLKAENGGLYIKSSNGDFNDVAMDDGVYLYRTIPGGIDFDARVKITDGDFASFSGTTVPYNMAGIVVRLTDYTAAGDILCLYFFEAYNFLQVFKTIDDAVQVEQTASMDDYASLLDYPWMRLTRVGNLFTGYTSNDGTNWYQTASVERADLEGLDLRVGLTQCNFTASDTASATLDDFTLTHEKVASVGDIHTNSFRIWSQNRNVVIESMNNDLIQSSRLYTIDGRMIASQDHVNDLRCTFKNLGSGLYIVSAEVGGSTQARKVVVR